jgi:hypothetical protein
VMQGRDCALTYPQSCACEGVSLVWNAECSWEYPLSAEAKSPRSTAHTQLHKKRNKSLLNATPATSAPIAKRFSAWAVHADRHEGRRAAVRCCLHQGQLYADSVLCKVARTDQTGPMETSSDHLGCCSAARHCGHSCILQHFCWLKRRCADKPDLCTCGYC